MQAIARLLSLFALSSYTPSSQLQALASRTLFASERPLSPADLVMALHAYAALRLGITTQSVIQLALRGTKVCHDAQWHSPCLNLPLSARTFEDHRHDDTSCWLSMTWLLCLELYLSAVPGRTMLHCLILTCMLGDCRITKHHIWSGFKVPCAPLIQTMHCWCLCWRHKSSVSASY